MSKEFEDLYKKCLADLEEMGSTPGGPMNREGLRSFLDQIPDDSKLDNRCYPLQEWWQDLMKRRKVLDE